MKAPDSASIQERGAAYRADRAMDAASVLNPTAAAYGPTLPAGHPTGILPGSAGARPRGCALLYFDSQASLTNPMSDAHWHLDCVGLNPIPLLRYAAGPSSPLAVHAHQNQPISITVEALQ